MKLTDLNPLIQKIRAKYSSAAEIEIKFDAGREIEDFAILVTVLSKKDYFSSPFNKEFSTCWISVQHYTLEESFGAICLMLDTENDN